MALFFKSGALAYCHPSFFNFYGTGRPGRHVRKEETQVIMIPLSYEVYILTLCNCTPRISKCISTFLHPIRAVKRVFMFNSAFWEVHYEEHGHLCSVTASHGVLISSNAFSLMCCLKWVFNCQWKNKKSKIVFVFWWCLVAPSNWEKEGRGASSAMYSPWFLFYAKSTYWLVDQRPWI